MNANGMAHGNVKRVCLVMILVLFESNKQHERREAKVKRARAHRLAETFLKLIKIY